MPAVAFVAPHLLEASVRFIDAAARLEGVRLGLVTSEPLEALPPQLRQSLSAHWRVDDAMDPRQIAEAVRGLSSQIGRVERLMGILEQLQVPLAQVRESLGITGMDATEAHSFRDKSTMKDVLRAAGIPVARHRLVGSPDDAMGFASEVGFPIVVKPPAGAGARSTYRLDDAEHLRRWLEAEPPSPGHVALLEEFLSGEEFTFDSVTIGGRVIWHSIASYLPPPLEVLRNPWMQWVVVLPREIGGPEFDPIRQVGPAALRALGMHMGLSHMEWFRRSDGSIAVSEVGARPPGAQLSLMLGYAHDVDMHAEWARMMIYDTFDPPPRRWSVGTAYLRGQGVGRVSAVHGVEALQRDLGDLVIEAKLPQVGQAPSGSYEGEGFVIVRHRETPVVQEALQRIVNDLRVELA